MFESVEKRQALKEQGTGQWALTGKAEWKGLPSRSGPLKEHLGP